AHQLLLLLEQLAFGAEVAHAEALDVALGAEDLLALALAFLARVEQLARLVLLEQGVDLLLALLDLGLPLLGQAVDLLLDGRVVGRLAEDVLGVDVPDLLLRPGRVRRQEQAEREGEGGGEDFRFHDGEGSGARPGRGRGVYFRGYPRLHPPPAYWLKPWPSENWKYQSGSPVWRPDCPSSGVKRSKL